MVLVEYREVKLVSLYTEHKVMSAYRRQLPTREALLYAKEQFIINRLT